MNIKTHHKPHSIILSFTDHLFRKGFVILALILTLIIPNSIYGQSTPLTLIPTDDAYVNSSRIAENYGTDSLIKSDGSRTAYLKFNLASVRTVPVQKAEFRFYVTESSASTHVLKTVYKTTWLERYLTYKSRPPGYTTVVGQIVNPQKGRWYSVDVTAEVQKYKGNVWSFSIQNTGKADSFHFYSKNNSSNKPQLVIYPAGSSVSPTKVPTAGPTVTRTPTATVTKAPTPTTRPLSATPNPTKAPTATPTVTRAPSPTATPTRVPTTVPSPTSQPGNTSGVFVPSQWKLTLPIGSSGKPTEIKYPQLSQSYQADPWFVQLNNGTALRFRAPVNGVTTSGSSYPRAELREMKNNGEDGADWSSSSGTHTMYLDQAITMVPKGKKHVVAGQIHDGGDDIIVIRLEDKHLFINPDNDQEITLDSNYTLGKRFNVRFVVNNNQTKVYYNGVLKFTYSKSYSGAYFKAGAYTQSNCDRPEEENTPCDATNYGEVVIYKAEVTHN